MKIKSKSKFLIVIELEDEWLDRLHINSDEIFADVTLYKTIDLKRQCDYGQRIYRCWCPLKPMPEKEIVSGFDRYEEGYNDCIDELLEGGKEDEDQE